MLKRTHVQLTVNQQSKRNEWRKTHFHNSTFSCSSKLNSHFCLFHILLLRTEKLREFIFIAYARSFWDVCGWVWVWVCMSAKNINSYFIFDCECLIFIFVIFLFSVCGKLQVKWCGNQGRRRTWPFERLNVQWIWTSQRSINGSEKNKWKQLNRKKKARTNRNRIIQRQTSWKLNRPCDCPNIHTHALVANKNSLISSVSKGNPRRPNRTWTKKSLEWDEKCKMIINWSASGERSEQRREEKKAHKR